MTDDERRAGGQTEFLSFVEEWNARQGQGTPAHHRDIAGWLAERMERCERNLLLMAFRGAGKSTIVGLFAAWLLMTNPDRRVMVIGPDQRIARRMVRNTMRIIETHPDTSGLRPKRRGSWSAEEFTVNRSSELRDPSMVARGILGNITGSRADVVICDDVEVPRTADSAPKREDLREKLSEIEYVMTPGGTQLYVGTPHTYYSIYANEARDEIGETHPFLHGFTRKVLPVWDENRVSAWPERFSIEHIERIRLRTGPAKFTTQMLLKPVSLKAGRLDPDLIRSYLGEPVYREAKGRVVLTLNGVRVLSASCWWDPAFASGDEKRRDSSVVAAVYGGEDGNLYLHRVLYLAVDKTSSKNEAQQQCEAVVELVRSFHLPAIAVETNGLGSFLPGLLREAMRKAGAGVAVVGVASHKPKDQRIVEALDAPLAAGRIHAHRSVWDTPLIREMREWRPGKHCKVHDDGLDAVAAAVAMEPHRFDKTAVVPGVRPEWKAGSVMAETDWNV